MLEDQLRQLLARLIDGGAAHAADIDLIAQSLLSSREARGLGFLALKKIIDGPGTNVDESSTQATDDSFEELGTLLGSCAESLLGVGHDGEVEPDSVLPVLAVLAAVFPLAPKAAILVLQRSITQAFLDDASPPISSEKDPQSAPDLMSLVLEVAELPGPAQLALAEMLAAATGSKFGRDFVRRRAMEWLEGAVEYQSADERGSTELGGLCAVALSKLSMAQDGDNVDGRNPGASADTSGVPDGGLGENDVYLADKMAGVVMASAKPTSDASSSTLISALEGLSVLSTRPIIKHKLAQDTRFLSALLALSPVPERKGGSLPISNGKSTNLSDAPLVPVDTGICYGITYILLHISIRKPALSSEDEQMAQLRAMASAASNAIAGKGKMGDKLKSQVDVLEEDEAVRVRVGQLYAAGVVSALSGLARAASRQVKVALGRLCLMLVMEQQHRAIFVRDGGFKVLGNVIRDTSSSDGTQASDIGQLSISEEAATTDLSPLQALAKLAITTPPPLLFPPPFQTTALNALTPLYTLLTHPSATVLQTFEALMALTNLASIDPSIANRIVTASVPTVQQHDMFTGAGALEKDVRILSKVEALLMDENSMVRRAATELACNLAGSPAGFAYLSGEGEKETTENQSSSRVASRLHLLLVLLDSDDLPTRLAAGGALAIVSDSATACVHMLSIDDRTTSRRSVWQRLANLFRPREMDEEDNGERVTVISSEAPDMGMMMRGAVILANLLQHAVTQRHVWTREKGKVDAAGVKEILIDTLKSCEDRDVLEPIVEALRTLQAAT